MGLKCDSIVFVGLSEIRARSGGRVKGNGLYDESTRRRIIINQPAVRSRHGQHRSNGVPETAAASSQQPAAQAEAGPGAKILTRAQLPRGESAKAITEASPQGSSTTWRTR